jgi:hypothetical protein
MANQPDNIFGHWESAEVCAFNDRLLQGIGTAWHDWLPVSLAWRDMPRYKDDINNAVKVLQKEFENSSLFVLKDPRLCRLAYFWTDAVRRYRAEPYFVIPIRNPLEVAQSLERRNKLNLTYSLLLWLRHVLDAERETRSERRFFLSYSDLLKDWKPVFSQMQEDLGLEFPNHFASVAREVSDFLRVDLRHNVKDDNAIIGSLDFFTWVRRVYVIILSWIERGENPDDYKELDSIFFSFNEASYLLTQIPELALVKNEPEKGRKLDSAPSATESPERELIAAQEFSLEALQAKLKNEYAHQIELIERLLKERVELTEQYEVERESLVEKITELAARSAEVENNLVQRREEIEQALAEARREEDLRHQAEQALADKETEFQLERNRADSLSGKLKEADAWVYKLAGDSREADLKFARLHRKLNDLNKKNISLLARLEAPRVDLSLVARVEAAEQEASEQRRLAAQELEQLQSINATLEKDNSNLNEQLVALSSARMSADRKLNERQTEIAQMTLMLAASEANHIAVAEELEQLQSINATLEKDNSNLNEQLVALSSARMNADRKLNERQTEIAQMTLMLATSEANHIALAKNFSWLQAVYDVLLRGPRFRWLRSRKFIKKWHFNELLRQDLFNNETYSSKYPDVEKEGMDPLEHYIRHGLIEGRSNGI